MEINYNNYPDYHDSDGQPSHSNSMNSSHISFTSGIGKSMGRSKKARRPIISKTEEIGRDEDYVVEDQIISNNNNNWKSNPRTNESNNTRNPANKSNTV